MLYNSRLKIFPCTTPIALTMALSAIVLFGCKDEKGDAKDGGVPDAGADAGLDDAGDSGDTVPTLEVRIDTPNPFISVDKPVFTSTGVSNKDNLVNARYHSGATPTFDLAAEGGAPWAAINVGVGPSRVLITWADAGWNAYNSQAGGAPTAYRIETSGDSTNGTDGTWEMAVEVTDHALRTAAHTFPFAGKSWVKMTVTAVPEGGTEAQIDELAVYDISASGDAHPEDTWFFMGDSITQGAFHRDLGVGNNFDEQIVALVPGFEPALLNGGIGGELASDGASHIVEWLAINPDFQNFAIFYGTNDSWGNKDVESSGYEEDLRGIIEPILADGRIPYLATIPYADDGKHNTLPDFNAVVDRITAEYGLPLGPDLYTWFQAHPDELTEDGVHPSKTGYRSINRLWAEAVKSLYVPIL